MKYILLSVTLLSLVAYAALGQSSRTSPLVGTGGLVFQENGESILNGTDATFDFTTNTATPAIITSSDTDAVAGLTILPGGAAPLLLGGAATTNVTVNSDVGLTFAGNAESINNLTNDTFDFTASAAGGIVLTSSDDDAVAALSVYPGGASVLTLGAAATTNVIVDSVAGLTFAENNESINNIADSVFDFTRSDAGTVFITASDDDAVAQLNITQGGAAALVLGGNSGTQVQIRSDGGVMTVDGDVTVSPLSDQTNVGPNLGATFASHNQIIGIPKLNVTQSGAALPNGTATAELVTPLIASCAPITAGTEAAGTLRVTGAASYQYTAQATAADDDGFDCDVTGHAVNGTDTAGFWFMSDTALTAGTLDMTLDDGGVAEANAEMPAISADQVDEWVWIEVDFGTDCDATCADIDGLFVQVTAAGAATSEMDGTVIHIDTGGFWLDGAEVAIGDVLVGGVISVSAAPTAAGSANTPSELTEYTDYLVTYQTGADALVMITDQSANYGTTLEALQ